MWRQEVLTGHRLAKLASFGFGERACLKKIKVEMTWEETPHWS